MVFSGNVRYQRLLTGAVGCRRDNRMSLKRWHSRRTHRAPLDLVLKTSSIQISTQREILSQLKKKSRKLMHLNPLNGEICSRNFVYMFR